jgi:hypothetical protein
MFINQQQFRVLYREFLFRMVDLEVLSAQGDIKFGMAGGPSDATIVIPGLARDQTLRPAPIRPPAMMGA